MSYLKSFIIGSSFPSFILFLIAVDQEEKKTYTYNFYSKILPISIGLGNVLSRFIGEKLNWSLEKRLFYTTIIGVFYRIFTSKKMNYYKYNRDVDDILIDNLFEKILHKKTFKSNFMNDNDIKYLFESIENINIYKGNLSDSDIAFIKKK